MTTKIAKQPFPVGRWSKKFEGLGAGGGGLKKFRTGGRRLKSKIIRTRKL